MPRTGNFTVTYTGPPGRQVQLQRWMRDCGFDEVSVDAVGNVVGVYQAPRSGRGRLLTGSHYDTVRNGGKYDGRRASSCPWWPCAATPRRRRLRLGIEVVASPKKKASATADLLGSGAGDGRLRPGWLDQTDADGDARGDEGRRPSRTLDCIDRAEAARSAAQLPRLRRGAHRAGAGAQARTGPAAGRGHLHQRRRRCDWREVLGLASHAGTTPMDCAAMRRWRRPNGAGRRARRGCGPDDVGTVGLLNVPGGSINASRPLRSASTCAPTGDDAPRRDHRRRLRRTEPRSASAAGAVRSREQTIVACRCAQCVGLAGSAGNRRRGVGLPHRMPSGAGHDAMKPARGDAAGHAVRARRRAGISHNPRKPSPTRRCRVARLRGTSLDARTEELS